LSLLHLVLLVLAALGAASPSLAKDLKLASLTDHIDLALEASESPVGALAADFGLGPVDLNLQHSRSVGGLGQPSLYGRPKANPLARSSLADAGAVMDLAGGVTMPMGVSFGLDEWEEGNRNLRLIVRHALQLSDLQLAHRTTFINSFAADGTDTRRNAGRLALGLYLLGGHQEGVLEYDAAPLAQVSQLLLNTNWALADGAAAVVGLTHRPLTALSEARIGFRQPVGDFTMTSDVAADNGGGYGAGLRFSLPLGPTPKPETWSLSTLVANLRAERQPSVRVGSDALPLQVAN
jgi:hypothetical protein